MQTKQRQVRGKGRLPPDFKEKVLAATQKELNADEQLQQKLVKWSMIGGGVMLAVFIAPYLFNSLASTVRSLKNLGRAFHE
ncbi:MAG: hypothetical protein AAFQ94_30960 [Bacteroidota bacterium]